MGDKVLITEQYLEDIADAIRAKHGTEATYTPALMATAISNIPTGGGGGDLPEEGLVITGDCAYRFANDGWNWFINTYGNKITTSNISNCSYMFNKATKLEYIPFDINVEKKCNSYLELFTDCEKLKEVPRLYGVLSGATPTTKGMFQRCSNLKEIPYDYFNTFGGDDFWEGCYSKLAIRGYMFSTCHSLRKLPDLTHLKMTITNSYSYSSSLYCDMCYRCYALDEITNLPIIDTTGSLTSNMFSASIEDCHRIKDFTFKLQEDGTPYVVKWKNQTIDLSKYVGYCKDYHYSALYGDYNSGITEETLITDDATYQAYKDHPDSWTRDINYSRYNHDSVVATINSLPDTSAFLAEKGGTNTIIFKGASGAKTDGGAINTLTEEEIAVATAKGWTVSLK